MTQEPGSPLRWRMIEDMSLRQFGAKTQSDYVRVVREFAMFIGRSPDLAEPEAFHRMEDGRLSRAKQISLIKC